MLFARNRIAEHELSVAQFYVERGAYIAAAKRATDIITEYPGAPATAEALKILQRSYAKIGLDQEAKDTATVIAMNSDTVQYSDAPKPGLLAADPNALPPAPPAEAKADTGADPAAKPGLMSRIFGVFDTSKPENQHVYVIHTGQPAAAAPADAAGGAPQANGVAGAQAPADAPAKGGGFTLSNGFSSTAPADAAAADGGKKPDAAAPQAQNPPPQDKPGFFSWFAGLFSSLDSTKKDAAPVAVPPPAQPQQPSAASGGTTNPDTTK
jgi:hypothetical protein